MEPQENQGLVITPSVNVIISILRNAQTALRSLPFPVKLEINGQDIPVTELLERVINVLGAFK
jgi:hypothetical protein